MVGLQWGDEGKGKIVDFLAGGYEAVVRFNGGSNAGHTVVLDGKRTTFHLVPSGALKGKRLLIGPGVALDPAVLREELALLPADARERMTIDRRCLLVTPADRELDRVVEEIRGSNPVGTTMRGIGPAYAMRALRLAPRVADMIEGWDDASAAELYRRLGVSTNGLSAWQASTRELLAGLAGDVASELTGICEGGGSVLFETSQGALLDVSHGTYPFVTGTHTVATYAPAALGIPGAMAGDCLGVLKSYTTRVGAGPFPTEVSGEVGEHIRKVGAEYGATTGRPRRVGWLDLVALRYTIKLNGVKSLALSKVDVLSTVKEFRACIAYQHLGSEETDFQTSLGHLSEVSPVYESPFDLHGADYSSGLPPQGKKLVDYLESRLGVEVSIVSHGEERGKTIEL